MTVPSRPAALRAVFIGSDTLLLECAARWLEQGNEVAAIATDSARIRDQATERHLTCIDAGADLAAALKGIAHDYLFAITWLQLLPEAVLALPARMAINFHDGPLPRYAGLNAPVWALLHGEREHGVTWHRMAAGADTGPILLQRTFPIAADETAFTLNVRCFEAGMQTFTELIGLLRAHRIAEQAQDLSRRTVFARCHRPAAMACIDWQQPAAAIARFARALDHGGYRNPVGVPKVLLPGGVVVPGAAEVATGKARAGTVLQAGEEGLVVAAADGGVRLLHLRQLDGKTVTAADLQRLGAGAGVVLPSLTAETARRLHELDQDLCRGEDASVQRLAALQSLPVPLAQPAHGAPRPERIAVSVPAGAGPDQVAMLWLAFLARRSGTAEFDVGVRTRTLHGRLADLPDLALAFPPLRVRADLERGFTTFAKAMASELEALDRRGTALRELVLRHPVLHTAGLQLEPPVRLDWSRGPEPAAPGSLTLHVDREGAELRFDGALLSLAAATTLGAAFARFATAALHEPERALRSLPLLAEAERDRVLQFGKGSAGASPAVATVTGQFLMQAARTPERVALRCGSANRSYASLAVETARLSAHLRSLGAGPGERVGICLERGIDLVIAMLAVLRSGAAYVPLDPSWPRERLALMAEDARLCALVHGGEGELPVTGCALVDLARDAAAIAAADAAGAGDAATADDLAYVIYTSGSTGRPKGVKVQHRNVTSFFAGMDEVLQPATDPGTWLSVTSPSFDISVLELLWTLCRGFTVAIWTGDFQKIAGSSAARAPSFSLFYFASDEGERGPGDKYRLLMEGARFADTHGFEAVWTPERHFHAFGGLYPNPAVASAAVAAITKNVRVRAGSVVLPLHHPIRIAEEWALVDNLSHGRVDIAFASGWQPDDFVLRPETFADRKRHTYEGIRTVQALWRGEAREFPGPKGTPVTVRTLPRPVQKELGTWVTIAGNPDTFRAAGELGANVLTHLLGQSIEQVTEKVNAYRQARARAGHAGPGRVTLMLHSFVGPDPAAVREIVREPMKRYLESSVDIVRAAAWSFPAFQARAGQDPARMEALLKDGLRREEMDALLEFAFERYYGTSGLFGSPEQCLPLVERLAAIGIDEIACLIDFGVPGDLVLEHLPHLDRLRRLCTEKIGVRGGSVPELIEQGAVSHLQGTPSLLRMVVEDPAGPAALRRLRHLLVGGEALPPALARQLRELVPNVHNMYGPTETTVWSTTWPVPERAEAVSIGGALRNQQVYVLDHCRELVATSETGEIWIGGHGVAAGYWQQPALTGERFVPDPFAADPNATMYRTGDLGRWRPDGQLEYQGRADFQVKVRGQRLEPGEIEAALAQHPAVREAVVMARGDAADTRLCAYVTARPGQSLDTGALRTFLRERLPEVMVPADFVALRALPLTPNGKIDRKALPPPDAARPARARATAAANDLEDAILQVWRAALGTDDVSVEDNFFDVGGHSILAVRVHRELEQKLGAGLQITLLFRFPTVRSLATHLAAGGQGRTAAQEAAERARARRERLSRGR